MRIWFLTCVVCLGSYTAWAEVRSIKEWTYLFYVAGDEEEIDRYSRVPIRKFEDIGSDDSRWLIAHADLYFDESGLKPISEPAVRYEIQKSPSPWDPNDYSTLKITSPIVWKSQTETHSGSPEDLLDFIRWGMANYPARHYGLFILGHGWGWRGVGQDYNPGFAIPQPLNGLTLEYLMMSPNQFGAALSQVFSPQNKLDLLVMDSCHMGMLEFLYEIRNSVDIYVAATTEMPFMSFDYQKSFEVAHRGAAALSERLVLDAIPTFARNGSQVHWEGDYPALSMYALDLKKLDRFWNPFRHLLEKLQVDKFVEHFAEEPNQWTDGNVAIDVYEFLRELAKYPSFHAEAAPLLSLFSDSKPSWDRSPIPVPVTRGARVTLRIQGDDLSPPDKALEEARFTFDYLNPHLIHVTKAWSFIDGKSEDIARVDFVAPITGMLDLYPYLPGGSWVEMVVTHGKKTLYYDLKAFPQTFHVSNQFNPSSAFLAVGHTFGTGRSYGPSLNLDSVLALTQPENYHWTGKEFLAGREYYQSLSFAMQFGWDDLLFSAPTPKSPLRQFRSKITTK